MAARALAWLAAGATIAVPLIACQPQPSQRVPATTVPTTEPTTSPAATADAKVVEVVKEKIVYVDRPVASDEVIASVGGIDIKFSDLKSPLLKGYGYKVLMNTVQLKLAQNTAKQRGITVTPEDVAAETRKTITEIAPDVKESDYAALIDQLAERQGFTRPDFDVVMEINSTLRKIAVSMTTDDVPESMLMQAFNDLYGETVRVRHIALSNMQEVGEAKKRLALGSPFELVAREMSQNGRSGPLGGELPTFSKAAQGLTETFKEAAFALKEGEVSDAVLADGFYHLIKLEKRIPPKGTKFEDVKESLKTNLKNRMVDAAVRQFRETLGQQARATLKIHDETLNAQYQARLKAAEEQAKQQPAGR